MSTHRCGLDVETHSKSGLPVSSPTSGKRTRWLRRLKTYFQVSERHYLTKQIFRSQANLVAEKKRHYEEFKWYTIHPYSLVALYLDVIMSWVWLNCFFLQPWSSAFLTYEERLDYTDPINIYCAILTTIKTFYIMVSFFMGYEIISTRHIVLGRKDISLYYLKSYFILDIIGVIPFHWLCFEKSLRYKSGFVIFEKIVPYIQHVRIKTFLVASRTITTSFFSTGVHNLTFAGVLIFAVIHWMACLLYFIPSIEFLNYGRYTSDSWVVASNAVNESSDLKYIKALHIATLHFCSAGTSYWNIQEFKEQIMCSSITLVGAMCISCVICFALDLLASSNVSESKYEELLQVLKAYCITKKFPTALKKQLFQYYEYRFNKRYFKESQIKNTLSEHLHYEIVFHTCKHILNLKLFQGLSKAVQGAILANLHQEVYLPQEVVFSREVDVSCVYIVAYGCVALYTKEGIELIHLEDGGHFGVLSLMLPQFKNYFSAIAVERTEMFILKKNDFYFMYNSYEDFKKRIEKDIQSSLDDINLILEQMTRNRNKHDIIRDLRRGNILERKHIIHRNIF